MSFIKDYKITSPFYLSGTVLVLLGFFVPIFLFAAIFPLMIACLTGAYETQQKKSKEVQQ